MSLSRLMSRCALFLTCLALSVVTAAATPLNDYKHELVKYYGALGFHPLLVPQGHRVGDVIEIDKLGVVWEQERCFPGLETEESGGTVTLPSLVHLKNAAANIWVDFKKFLGFKLGAGDMRRILLNLEDVSVESASLGALRDALDERCSELLPIFENDRMPRVSGRRVNIVAAVLKGRVNTVFSHSGDLQAEAAVKNLADLLRIAPPELKALAPELTALYGLSERANVVVRSGQIQTVAYRPATIFHPGFSAKHTDEITVEPFDPENVDHRELLDLQARSWAARPDIEK